MENDGCFKENYKKLEECVLNLLAKRLPKNRYYHNPDHTIDVINVSERLAELEGISPEDRDFWITKTGALIHDVGHIFTYQGHEEKSAEFAKESLPKYGYTKEQIDIVANMIMATQLPQNPKTLGEEIVCDADLRNLGGDDFFERGKEIRRELEAQGIEMSDKKWYTGSLDLLEGHRYHTKSARKLGQEGKERNIRELKGLLGINHQ